MKLALSELNLACQRLSSPVKDIKDESIVGIRYLSFSSKNSLTDNDLLVISNLSFIYALFLEIDGILKPLKLTRLKGLPEKLSNILKYKGKTNELFTRMMINVALLSSDFDYKDEIELLDPVAGRGTTLFEASIYGFNAFGTEIEPKSVHEAQVFFKKFLQNERLKFKHEKRQVAGNKKTDATFMDEFLYAKNKEDFKDTSRVRRLGIVQGNSAMSDQFFKKNSKHLIVGDLPYGVQHGNKQGAQEKGITRSPEELVKNCLPAWSKTLKKGGVLVLAWNSFVVSKKRMLALFDSDEYENTQGEDFYSYEHMVDQSIKRDILVMKKL